MNQCADPIDTQHNVLFDVWRRNVPQWLDETTCGREGCICKEQGFRDMKSQDDLFTFLFCGECAAVERGVAPAEVDVAEPATRRVACHRHPAARQSKLFGAPAPAAQPATCH